MTRGPTEAQKIKCSKHKAALQLTSASIMYLEMFEEEENSKYRTDRVGSHINLKQAEPKQHFQQWKPTS